MSFTLEHRKKQYRTIYELLHEMPRIRAKPLSRIMKTRPSTASSRMKEAFEQGYIVGPQIRKRSFSNLKEYMYFINCEDPLGLFEEYIPDENVIYHSIMDGFANFRIVSKEKFKVKGDVVLEGYRSDYHISFAPDHSWGTAIQTMREMVQNFNPEDYEPQGIIKTHWNEIIEWDQKDEILFREFKYDSRKPLNPLMRKHHISKSKIDQWLKRLPECCTVFTCYFPEKISAYDPYVFMFETDFEDFIVDLFSELPTTSWFFKVSDRLLLYLWVDRGSMRSVDFRKPDISKLHIPRLLRRLSKEGIINHEAHTRVECYWREDLEEL